MKHILSLTTLGTGVKGNIIDTDMIIPAQFLTEIKREGYASALFKNAMKANKIFDLDWINNNIRSLSLRKILDAQLLPLRKPNKRH